MASPAPGRSGFRQVEQIMGTAIGLDVRGTVPQPAVVEAFFEALRWADRTFSTYRDDSEISRIGRGKLAEADASPEVRGVLARCDDVARTTGGAFDARGHRKDGRLDPSGLVKGWAVERAAGLLDAAGLTDYAINAGGDVLARGEPEPGRPWRVGIRHPVEADRVAAVLLVRDLAVATSGLYERGDHILDPVTGAAPEELASLTVVGPSLALADAYATAAFTMGRAGLAWIHAHPGYGALAIDSAEQVLWTPRIDGLRERGAEPVVDVAGPGAA